MRVALVSSSAPACSALGNQLAEKLEFFLDRAAAVRIVVESSQGLHPRLRGHCLIMPDPVPEGPAWQFLSSADLIIVDYGHFYKLLTLLPLLAQRKARVIIDYHGLTPADLWGSHHRDLLEKGLRYRGVVWYADAAVAHSRFTCNDLSQATGYPAERIKQLGFPLDAASYATGLGSFRTRLGLTDATVLLFVGRIAPNKRLPVLVETVAHLREWKPNVHAVAIGDMGDLYAQEVKHCQEVATQLGVSERLHFLGQIDQAELVDAYRSADALVMPSCHEGFCLPVIEAMACGLPVITARSTALPETVGDAGLTFAVDDATDLARQVKRVVGNSERGTRNAELGSAFRAPRSALSVVIVSVRYGTDFAGGAETSLRTIAETLHRAGHIVRVFTTCTRAESAWSNELPAGTTLVGGIRVQRFPIDAHDRIRHLETIERILRSCGPVAAGLEEEYLRNSIHSTALVEQLRKEADSVDAIIAGPYLFGLTHDTAKQFPDKTLVLPCFHDEPFAYLESFGRVYEACGGLLYHSKQEQEFAQTILGINHPRAHVIGTFLKGAPPDSFRRTSGPCTGRYLVYCGRYSTQKGVPELLEFARKYDTQHPQRFRFVFLGQGEVKIPQEDWAIDLGFVSADRKHAVLAGAEALVQLSRLESLSLVTLEAWAQGTPVIVHADCPVVAGHVADSGGGVAVGSYESFAKALDSIWDEPEAWKRKGRRGAEYVHRQYGSLEQFLGRLEDALSSLRTPIQEQMRRRGIQRASQFNRAAWREQFGRIVDEVLENPQAKCFSIELQTQSNGVWAAAGARSLLIPVRVSNTGSQPALPEGPGGTLLYAQVLCGESRKPISKAAAVPIPNFLCPGQSRNAAIPVTLPSEQGSYAIALWAERADLPTKDPFMNASIRFVELLVSADSSHGKDLSCSTLLESVQQSLAEAFDQQQLPDDYLDVTEGALAGLKRRIKKKLLNNFKQAYVDVLSRRQTQVNRNLVDAVRQLSECCATLDHAVRMLHERISRLEEKLTPRETPSLQLSETE